jgi:RNA polymerase sigma factor (sigma-70 family)
MATPARVTAPISWRGAGTARLAVRRRRRERSSAEALEAIYREHVGTVYGFFCYAVDRDAAEDLTAATFERVVRSWGRFDPSRARVETWIFAIARNVLIDHTRRQRHRSGPSLDEHPEIMDTIVRVDDPLTQAVGTEAIRGWLSGLRPREREVLALRYCADLSVREIATCLGTTEANVHQISSRALRRLRAAIAEPRHARAQRPAVTAKSR